MKKEKGFTLIEVLVSVGIFAVVMTIALGALLAMTESNRRVETMKSVINTLNFALDSMSRSIRTGVNYRCSATGTAPQSCASSPSTALTFLAANGSVGDGTLQNVQVAYCRGNNSTCSSSGTAILRSIDGGATFAPITSREVVIETLNFYVIGAESGDGIQPKVTVLLTGYVDVSATQRSRFNLQTSITQRLYDL